MVAVWRNCFRLPHDRMPEAGTGESAEYKSDEERNPVLNSSGADAFPVDTWNSAGATL